MRAGPSGAVTVIVLSTGSELRWNPIARSRTITTWYFVPATSGCSCWLGLSRP